jgi:hypothetical protein
MGVKPGLHLSERMRVFKNKQLKIICEPKKEVITGG